MFTTQRAAVHCPDCPPSITAAFGAVMGYIPTYCSQRPWIRCPGVCPVCFSVWLADTIYLHDFARQQGLHVHHSLCNSFISSGLCCGFLDHPPAPSMEGFDGTTALLSHIFTETCKKSL